MRNTALLILLICVGCAEMDASRNCRIQAGPQPYFFAGALGPIGEVAADQTDSRLAWNKSVNDCIDKWRAANP